MHRDQFIPCRVLCLGRVLRYCWSTDQPDLDLGPRDLENVIGVMWTWQRVTVMNVVNIFHHAFCRQVKNATQVLI